MSRGRATGLALLLTVAAGTGVRAEESRVELRLQAGTLDPLRDAIDLPERLRHEGTADRYVLVQLDRPLDPTLAAALQARVARTIAYVPDRAYLVALGSGSAEELRGVPGVRWVGPVQPGWKLSPRLRRDGAEPTVVTIDLVEGEAPGPVSRALSDLGIVPVQTMRFSDTTRIKARGTVAQLEAAARLAAVHWIEPLAHIAPRNDDAHWVVQTNALGSKSIWARGLHGEGQVVGHIDEPLDLGSCFFRDASNDTPGPGHRKVVAYRSSGGPGASDHGSHTAGSVAGDRAPISGSISSRGHAWAARLSHTVLADITGSGAQPSNLYAALAAAHADGARVHSNSWGDDGTAAYTTWSRDVDRFARDFEDSLVVFAVSNGETVRSPENAKNALAVAASNNGVFAWEFCSGGTGPTPDGRRKPEIVGPGCPVVSADGGSSCATRSEGGTSMACAAVAGAAVLARQYFGSGFYPVGQPLAQDAHQPSAALVKAVLVNSAVDLGGLAGYPGDREGWGRVLLENALYFGGDARRLAVLADRRNVEGLTTGEASTVELVVDPGSGPLEVTLAFTDPPADLLAASAPVNDLDLEAVSPSGATYRGNVFSGGVSVEGGTPDPLNNLETVLVPDPEPGTWTAVVRGTAVNEGLQGFALVATGAVRFSGSGIVGYDRHFVSDPPPLGNGDGVLDPGETADLVVLVRNLRSEQAGDVVGTLRAGGPSTAWVTRDAASYPDLDPGLLGISSPPHYRLTVSPELPCGSAIGMDLAVSSDLGLDASGFEVAIGQPSCAPLACGDPVPAGVGPTLLLSKGGDAGSDLRFDWLASPGADSYRLWRSDAPPFEHEELAGSGPASPLVLEGGVPGESSYYLLRAVNACGWEAR